MITITISSTTAAMVTMGITVSMVAMGISTALLARVLLEGDSEFNDGLSLELENDGLSLGLENDGLSLELENGSENVGENVGKDCVVSEFVESDIHGITGQICEWL